MTRSIEDHIQSLKSEVRELEKKLKEKKTVASVEDCGSFHMQGMNHDYVMKTTSFNIGHTGSSLSWEAMKAIERILDINKVCLAAYNDHISVVSLDSEIK